MDLKEKIARAICKLDWRDDGHATNWKAFREEATLAIGIIQKDKEAGKTSTSIQSFQIVSAPGSPPKLSLCMEDSSHYTKEISQAQLQYIIICCAIALQSLEN